MATSTNINTILSQVKLLDKEEQLTLLQRLAGFIKQKGQTASTPRLISLSGLGSEIWKGKEDIDQYLDEERQW